MQTPYSIKYIKQKSFEIRIKEENKRQMEKKNKLKNKRRRKKKWWKIKPVSQPLRSVYNMHTAYDARCIQITIMFCGPTQYSVLLNGIKCECFYYYFSFRFFFFFSFISFGRFCSVDGKIPKWWRQQQRKQHQQKNINHSYSIMVEGNQQSHGK